MYNFQLKAYRSNLLNEFSPTLIDLLKKSDSASFIRMPSHTKRFTLLKSPHVNKTAREQFEIRIHNSPREALGVPLVVLRRSLLQ